MPGSRPKVSIVLPTYNRAAYIGETIASIRAQTYNNWELIIVDDGSIDETENIISAITDERIIFHKAGRIGINGKIKNIGIRLCKGDLIAFIDSDDLWANSKLEKQVFALDNYPEAGFSLTGGYNFRNPHRPVDFFYKQKEGIRYGDIFIPFFQSEISATTPSLMIRRQCLEKAGSFDESKAFSDIDYILHLASQFKAIILYEALLFRRLHDANDSGVDWVKGYEEGIKLIARYRDRLPRKIGPDARFKLYINYGEDCLLNGQRKKAVQQFFRSWLYKPFSLVPLKKLLKVWFKGMLGHDVASSVPWQGQLPPRRVLVIRLQAMGDVVITLPYLLHLRQSLPPSTKIDFLTRKECDEIPRNLRQFDRVISLRGGRNPKKQWLHLLALHFKLSRRRYDLVIDLQNNDTSLLARKIIQPAAWSVFDRFSSKAAGERTRLTIEAAGLGSNEFTSNYEFRNHLDTKELLKENGWDGKSRLVILNPASAFPTRNWPIENYASFARLWLKEYPATQFLLLGTPAMQEKALYLRDAVGERLINMINKTSAFQAFVLMREVSFALSEDSGLMHMAWVSGVTTLAMFGSTRSDWARPLSNQSSYLDSSDLPCGNCMQEICAFGDNHCMTRYSPEFVFEKAVKLAKTLSNKHD